MWVKSLDENDWVNMVHITNFSIEETGLRLDCKTYEVYAFLDASRKIFNPFNPSSNLQEPAFIIVCRGTYIECEEFVKRANIFADRLSMGRLYCGSVILLPEELELCSHSSFNTFKTAVPNS